MDQIVISFLRSDFVIIDLKENRTLIKLARKMNFLQVWGLALASQKSSSDDFQ